MSTEPAREGAPHRRARVVAIVLAALAIAVLAFVLAMSQQDPTGRDGVSEPGSSVRQAPSDTPRSTLTTSPTATSTPIGPSGSPAASEEPPTPGSDTDPIPVKGTAPVGGTAEAGSGVSISVPSVAAITAGGEGGIGDLAGPAMAVSVRVKNGGEPLALNEVVVTATYGPDRTPAPPVINDPRSDPLTGQLPPGSSATGVYVFSLPDAGRDGVRILVSYAGGKPSVAFTGDVK